MRSERLIIATALAAFAFAGSDASGDARVPGRPPAVAASGSVRGTVDASLARQLADAVVAVKEARGSFVPPGATIEVEQRERTFLPHVLPVVVGTRVRFPNRDVVRHNVFSPSRQNAFNFGIYLPGDTKEVTFDHPGVVTLLCNIHKEMSGYVLVLQNPYFARVGEGGRYAIEGIPDGSYTLELWVEGKPVRTSPVVVRGGAVVADFR